MPANPNPKCVCGHTKRQHYAMTHWCAECGSPTCMSFKEAASPEPSRDSRAEEYTLDLCDPLHDAPVIRRGGVFVCAFQGNTIDGQPNETANHDDARRVLALLRKDGR